MSSFMMVPAGSKRSLNLSFDFADNDQRLLGYHTLNLLNANGDPTFLRTMLYSEIARRYIPAPKANLSASSSTARAGACTSTYSSSTRTSRATSSRARRARGGRCRAARADAAGSSISATRRRLQAALRDQVEGRRRRRGQALIELCRVLNETPPDRLEAALAPMLDVDGR